MKKYEQQNQNCMLVADLNLPPINNISNVRKLYEDMYSLQREKGALIVKDFGKVVEYEIFD